MHVAFFADMTNQDRIHWLNIDHVAASDSSFREILAKTEVLDLDPSLPTGAELVRFRKQSAAMLRALFGNQLSKGHQVGYSRLYVPVSQYEHLIHHDLHTLMLYYEPKTGMVSLNVFNKCNTDWSSISQHACTS